MPAKRGINLVSITSRTKYFKHEPLAVQKWAEMKRKRAKREDNQRKALKISAANTPTITSMLNLLLPGIETEDNVDSILDDALTDYGTALNARVDDMHHTSSVHEQDVRTRLWEFHKHQVQTKNVRGSILANAYILLEQYLRDGNSDGKGGFSLLKAGRTVAKTVIPRSQHTRKNASRNRHNQLYWYRHRSRAIIIGYRYFVATGFLLPETRGKCKGTSLIHDPTVRHYCFEVIAQLGATWSARTFRDRISVKLYESGYLKPGTKIDRTTATFYLRTIGMVLVHPKKGIYKDGHECPDTVHPKKGRGEQARQEERKRGFHWVVQAPCL
jgi:hypothetical protein